MSEKEYTQEEVNEMTDEEYQEYIKPYIPPNVHQVSAGENKMITFTTYDVKTETFEEPLKRLISMMELGYFQEMKEKGTELSISFLPHQNIGLNSIPEEIGLKKIITEHCDMFDDTGVILRFWEIQDSEDGMQWFPVYAEI